MGLESAFSGLVAGDKISCGNNEYFVVRCIDDRYVLCLKRGKDSKKYVLAETYKWSGEQQKLLDEDFAGLPGWSEEVSVERGACIKDVTEKLQKMPTNAELNKILGACSMEGLEKKYATVISASKASLKEFESSGMNPQMILMHYFVVELEMDVDAAFQAVLLSTNILAGALSDSLIISALKKLIQED